MKAPLPPNERERLEALRRYAILDTPQEPAFDRITRLVATMLKVPMATVTLVDEQRQWFKSAYGMTKREDSRDLAFCAHAILQDDIMVVSDAARDERFSDNPLVTGDPRIRFYAGAPLRTAEGFNLGTLCAIDTQPRRLSAEEAMVLSDLAAIVRDELELRLALRERSQLAAAVFHLDSGVLVTDPALPDNPIVFGNPGFWAMTGYMPDEVIGRNCRFLQGAETDAATVDAMRDAIEHQRTFRGEILNYRKDGSPFWNELTISPVFNDDGQLINFVGLQTDVTERRKLEALRDSLTHMIIHDLRGPLTTTLGFLDILRSSAPKKLGEEERKFVEIAYKGAEALNEMITTLLDVNRLEAGEMPLTMEDCDLAELVRRATAGDRALQGAHRLTLELPPAPLRCDSGVIRRVLANLVSNALKFTPEPGAVHVRVSGEGACFVVSVIDSGPGIPREYHAKIFEKFGQVESRRQLHSTGLGLAFCKLAIETHGGTIWVESEPGKGSTFSFTLPRNGA